MSPKTTPETPIRIDSAEQFRKEVGLAEPVALEWKEGQVIEATRTDLDGLKTSIAGKVAIDKQKDAEAFLRAREKKEAEKDLTAQIGDEVSKGLQEKLVKSGLVVGATGAAMTLAHSLSDKVQETTGIKISFWSKIQSWATDELKTASNSLWKWILGLIAGKGVVDEVDDEVKKKDAEPNPVEKERAIKDGRVKLTIAGLLKFSPIVRENKVLIDPKHNIQQVFTYDTVLSRKYTELKTIHTKYAGKNPSGIEKDLGIKSLENMSPETMYLALHLIVADEKFLSLFQSKKPGTNWKDKQIGELLQIVSTDIGSIQTLSKIKDPTELQKMFDESRDLFSLSEDGKEQGELSGKIGTLREKGYKEKITPRVLSDLFVGGGRLSEDIMGARGYTEKEKEFVRELTAYGEKLPSTIMADPRVNLGVKGISESFSGKLLSPKEVFALFLITEGETTLDHISGFGKFNVYRVLLKTLGDNGRSSVTAGEYKTELIKELLKDSTGMTSKLPEDVRLAFSTVTGGMRNMITDYIINMGGQLAGAMKDPVVATLIVTGVIGVMYIGRVVLLSKAVIAGIIGTILALGAVGVTAGTQDKLKELKTSLEK